jgi:TatD DNase family protein
MHVHLGFMRDAPAVVREAEEAGLGLFACSVTPGEYERLSHELAVPHARVAAGLHPWWVADGRCMQEDAERVAEFARMTRFVGEIGLDASPKHVPAGSLPAQIRAFETICEACAQASEPDAPHVLSIHAVHTGSVALDVLGRTGALESCRCIFHWFSGTSDELHRAVRAGCWFSMNTMGLQTRKGREYAKLIPSNRLLTETDHEIALSCPEDFVLLDELRDSLINAIELLAEARTTEPDELRALVATNAEKLLW